MVVQKRYIDRQTCESNLKSVEDGRKMFTASADADEDMGHGAERPVQVTLISILRFLRCGARQRVLQACRVR